jgi:glycosyltransferase involved in cell wall biosynthesis
MRILQVIDTIDPARGGPIECVRRMNPELARLGHSVEVLSLDDATLAWRDAAGAPVHSLGETRGRYAWTPRLQPWLRANRDRYDVAVVHGLWQYAGLGVRRGLRGSATRYVVFPHGMLDPWFARAHPRKHLKKRFYWPWGEYRVLRDAAAVLFTCDEERRLARESFARYRAREHVVAFGTAEPPAASEAVRSSFLAACPEIGGRPYLLFLGRLNPKKGCDLLIDAYVRAVARGATFDLVMAGPDDAGWRTELESRAARGGAAARIHWTGMLEGDAKWGALHGCDALILPSHQENFGIVVAEALGCGKPVLISERVNIWREVIADGAGFAADDTAAGTDALLAAWCSASHERRRAMGVAAVHCFERRFTARAMAASVADVLASIAVEPGVSARDAR